MNYHLALKVMLLALQVNWTEPFSLIHFGVNLGAQYFIVCFSDLPLNMSELELKHFFTPIRGLGVARQYIQLAESPMEQAKLFTQVAFCFGSSISALSSNPGANMACGGWIFAYLGHIKNVIEKTVNFTNSTDLLFINPNKLSILNGKELLVLELTISGGLVFLRVSYMVIPKIAIVYYRFYKNLSKKILNFKPKKFHLKLKSKLKNKVIPMVQIIYLKEN